MSFINKIMPISGFSSARLLEGSIAALWRKAVLDSDRKLVQWTDLSAYGQHAVRIPGVDAPTMPEALTPQGLPYLQFSGAQGLWIPNFQIPPGTKDLTFFWATNALAPGSSGRVYAELTPRYDLSKTGFQLYRTAAFGITLNGDVGINRHTYGVGSGGWQAVRAEAYKSNSGVEGEVRIYRDGTLSTNALTTVDNTNDFQSADLYIGCRAGTSWFLDDPMAALIIFPFKVEGARARAIEKAFIKTY